MSMSTAIFGIRKIAEPRRGDDKIDQVARFFYLMRYAFAVTA
jgi:hypothetical protein